jgi:RNA polymerase sigma factor (sigma-70 family)
MKDYRVTIKVRNNRILRAIEESGGTPGQKWCKANGLCYKQVNEYINMVEAPTTSMGDLRPSAIKLCEVVDKIPQDLWSSEQLFPLETNIGEMEMDYLQVTSLLSADEQSYLPEFPEIQAEQTSKLLDDVLNTLPVREQKVIKARFYDDLSLEECAKLYDVTRERIRQIEQKALKKLRQPCRIGIIADCLDLNEKDRAYYKNATKEQDEKIPGWRY